MFKKLVSNLPFNPSLIEGISFYAKRLHKEEAIRRIGAIFTVMAMIVQIVAVMSPAQAAFAQSENDVVYGGFSSTEKLAQTYDSGCDGLGRCDIKQVFTSFGISSASQIRAGQMVTISDNQSSYTTHGRSVSSKGYIGTKNAGGTLLYQRKLSVWGVSSWSALEVVNDQGQKVWILQDCGNPTILASGDPVLNIQKLASPIAEQSVTRGSSITYTLAYSNTGTAAAEGFNITDTLPAEISFGTLLSGDAVLKQNAQTLTFYQGANQEESILPAGSGNRSTSFTATIKADAPLGRFCNSAVIFGSGYVVNQSNDVCHTIVDNTPPPTVPVFSVVCSGADHLIRVDGSGTGTVNVYIDGVADIGPGAGTTLPWTKTYGAGAGHTYTAQWNGAAIGGASVGACTTPPTPTPPTPTPPTPTPPTPTPPTPTPPTPTPPTPTPPTPTPPTPTPPPCPHNPSLKPDDPTCVPPQAECVKLETPLFLTRNKVQFTIRGSVKGTATISSFTLNPGDGGKFISIATTSPIANLYTSTTEYTYPEDGEKTYKAVVIAQTSLGERLTSACEQTVTIPKEKTPIIVITKSVSNVTQKLTDAHNSTGNPGDEILYTIRASNIGDATQNDYIFPKDNLQDVLDYADLVDKKTAELITEGGIQSLTWKTPVTITAGSTIEKQFVVKIKSAIPKTNSPAGDPTKYDCKIENTIGGTQSSRDTVVIKFNAVQCKPVELVVKTLPNTGPGSSLALTFVGALVVIYFYSRSRLLAKEADVIRYEYSQGNI